MKEIGLIGYGNFGKLIYSILKDHFKIHIYDVKTDGSDDFKFSSLQECAGKNIVIISVPVQSMEKVLIDIKGFVKKESLVFDVSSVKMKPSDLMARILPEDCEIIATHPLFGP